MKNIRIVKNNLLSMLSNYIDKKIYLYGFNRKKSSTVYKRMVGECIQEIDFVADFFPSSQVGAEAQILPSFALKLPIVSEKALELVDGNKMLLANAPELIIKQPIEFFAPKEMHERWYVMQESDYKIISMKIYSFIERWLLSTIDSLVTVNDLIGLYQLDDSRILKQTHWYVFIVSAYLLNCDREKAIDVFKKHFSKSGIKRRYESVFRNI